MSNPTTKYHFVIATQYNHNDFWEKSQIAIFLEKASHTNDCSIFFENKEGLPTIYNKFINDSYKGKKVIFVHDDVLIEDLFILEKLDLAFEKYDIVGLAGSKKVDLSKPPAWHLMSDRQDHCGEVAHSHQKQVWTTCFGPSDSRVLVMDGLFMAVNVKSLLNAGVRFDERFDFHHYDITLCLRANKNKLKMGVTPIRVVHFGLGDSMNTPEWNKSAGLFKEYYEVQR
jgi:GT2 family glycosyltransferase